MSAGTRTARGERAKALKPQQPAKTPSAAEAPVSEFATRVQAAWARLIRKVYEADPLKCPKCKGPMRVIALIDDPHVVRRILNTGHVTQPALRFGRSHAQNVRIQDLCSTRIGAKPPQPAKDIK
jgi:hypothetical protein